MANIIIKPWGETPAEESLRQKGYSSVEKGCMETGIEFGAALLRKENVGEAMQKIMRALWELRQAMADQQWDDDKVYVVIGMQARNGWEQSAEGEWFETGSKAWLDNQAKKAILKP
jgi:hypothetical protein